MANECLTYPCSLCGKRITGANWQCPNCKICICFFCGVQLEDYLTCPKCGSKLE